MGAVKGGCVCYLKKREREREVEGDECAGWFQGKGPGNKTIMIPPGRFEVDNI